MARSEHATVAAIIRKHLKVNGVKARVKSSSASMTNSVDVYLENELPATVKAITEYCDNFKSGDFNDMDDIYEYRKDRDGPTVKYIFVHNSYTDEINRAAWDYICERYADDENEEITASYEESGNVRIWGTWGNSAIWRVLNGSTGNFWTSRKPRVRAA